MIRSLLGAAALAAAAFAPAAAQANSLMATAPGYDPAHMGSQVTAWGLPMVTDETSEDGKVRGQVFAQGAVAILLFYGGCANGTDCAGVAMVNPLPTAQMGVRLSLSDINAFNSASGYAFLSDEGDGITATNWGSPALRGCARDCQADQFTRFTGAMAMVVEDLVSRRGQSLVSNERPAFAPAPIVAARLSDFDLPGLTPLAEAEATTGLLRRADALMGEIGAPNAGSLAEEFFPVLPEAVVPQE